MLTSLMLMALAASTAQTVQSIEPVQSKNGEFIMRQYPPRAKAAGEQGTVRFRADVNAKGNVLSCMVTGSSGHRRLDDETCEMIVGHASFRPALDSEGKAREATHDGFVNWHLPGEAADTQPQIAEAKIPDKLICKRIQKTGSLVAHSRLCLTTRDWDRYAEQFQDDWGSLQGRKGHTNGSMPTWSLGH